MAIMKKFEKDFVERTLNIIENSPTLSDYDVTLLLNCLLSLIVLPVESEKGNYSLKADEYKHNCVKKLCELTDLNINKIQYDKVFVYIRNSIAHLNIKILNNNNIIEKVSFTDYSISGKKIFHFTISVGDLKILAKYIAINYLKLISFNYEDSI